MAKKKIIQMPEKKKGFLSNLMDKLDKKLEKKSREKSGCCCKAGGKSCSK
ncbi:MAG: hypothetical protein ABIF85_02430 [Nanoarchaeota archaeon]|nr:hypothetical protein [Nanoarchaeota archaeon]MBU4451638.1 hypothetical protein [Nanoarchaeota archaeon]MCG2724075.1 hypothetical protein [archaeon]